MATVKGFRGFHYNPDNIDNFDKVITPPYDVVAPAVRGQLAEQSPYNMMHLVLPEGRDGKDQYQVAAQTFDEWIAASVMVQDPVDSFYLLEQEFVGLDGVSHKRRGFFAAVKIPEPGQDGVILKHERTFAKKIQDRLRLTEATQANLGPVFGLYQDPGKELKSFLGHMDQAAPDISARTVEGVQQRIWRVAADDNVTVFFQDRPIYIADGHHRFATAEEYRNRMRAQHGTGPDDLQAYDYLLMGLVAFDDPGLIVWPTHRLLDAPNDFDAKHFLDALQEWFDVREAGGQLDQKVQAGPGSTFGLAIHEHGSYVLTLQEDKRASLLGEDKSPVWRGLDVAVLHEGILERVLGAEAGTEYVYEPNEEAALACVGSGEKQMAFLLKALPKEQIRECAEAGICMPQKATYFFPKLPTGAVIHRLV